MTHVLTALSNGAVLLFVVTTMLAMGFSLTLSQILAPLRRVRLVVLALVANFVLVPLLAFALTRVIPLSDPLKIGVILLGVSAGADSTRSEVSGYVALTHTHAEIPAVTRPQEIAPHEASHSLHREGRTKWQHQLWRPHCDRA